MRIERIQLLRNVGQFGSVDGNLQLKKLALVYGENGRGKTTLAAILRSAATNDAALLTARQRLGSDHSVHVVLATDTDRLVFQNGRWSAAAPHIAIFDDHFVATNVCSGVEVHSSHRESLHELILGAQGVALVKAIEQHSTRIELLNRLLRARAEAIPQSVRGGLAVDEFCALSAISDVDTAITEQERLLAATRSSAQVSLEPAFSRVQLPKFDVNEIATLLARTLSDLDAQVVAHILGLGKGGEAWIGNGVTRISRPEGHDVCPFCTQGIADTSLLDKYRTFFGGAYQALKSAIREYGTKVVAEHSDSLRLDVERRLHAEEGRLQFWRKFLSIPDFAFELSELMSEWQRARDAVRAVLLQKYDAPLEPLTLPPEALALLESYEKRRSALTQQLEQLQVHNATVAELKSQAAGADVGEAEVRLARLQASRNRHREPVAAACDEYLAQKAAKAEAERAKAQARGELDQYREQVLPRYTEAINGYLGQLNAGFRLGDINSVNHRGGSSCKYTVLINNVTVNLTAESGPSFRNTVSAGDRNTLALAFFFASLDQDPQLAQKVVVLDDPMTSLDEHRTRNTVHAVRGLIQRVSQVIALSHSKAFLHDLCPRADVHECSAHIVQRATEGSTLAVWDIQSDFSTEHDRRHRLVTEYVRASNSASAREVATALRPMLEAYIRVAYPPDFRAGDLLGDFRTRCQQRVATADEILDQADLTELQALIDYGNRFHHETNPAYATAGINDQELTDYCRRTLAFTRRG